ncbi:hypothetical protein [Labilithrix luteola]|uniref:hypothetical protein n=1 Tax=Labilithrix luteola TaxID=1391654 RepID=UPI001F0B2EBB|nr:hypothetical protein [Labilithrix luteola]
MTGAARYIDARKNVFLSSGANISKVTDVVAGADYTAANVSGSIARTTNAFGTGVPGITFTPQGRLTSAWLALDQGTSVFWVSKHAATGSPPAYAGNVPLTVMGDSTGSVDHNAGFDGGQLAYSQYTGAWTQFRRGSGLNDGQARLVGWTHTKYGTGGPGSSELRAWVGTTQQGATLVDATTTYQDAGNGFDSIGMSYQTNDAAFDGTLGCFVVINGIISPADHALLAAWARQSWSTV